MRENRKGNELSSALTVEKLIQRGMIPQKLKIRPVRSFSFSKDGPYLRDSSQISRGGDCKDTFPLSTLNQCALAKIPSMVQSPINGDLAGFQNAVENLLKLGPRLTPFEMVS